MLAAAEVFGIAAKSGAAPDAPPGLLTGPSLTADAVGLCFNIPRNFTPAQRNAPKHNTAAIAEMAINLRTCFLFDAWSDIADAPPPSVLS